MKKTILFAAAVAASLFAGAATRVDALRAKLASRDRDYVFVAMHRGDWRNFPENSKGAILSCIALGADIVELDVRRTKEGRFVLMHDNKIDRTTTGKGLVSELTVPELKKFKMKMDGKPTKYDILTLEEALELTRGKILFNVDKFTEHPHEILDALAAAGALKEVIVKSLHSPEKAKELFGDYWPRVESGEILYMPVIQFCWGKHEKARKDLPLWIATEPRTTSMYEMCFDNAKDTETLKKILAAPGRPRIWINTMWDSLAAGNGEYRSAKNGQSMPAGMLAPDKTWGWAIDAGATMIQTDCGAELLLWLERKGLHKLGGRQQ